MAKRRIIEIDEEKCNGCSLCIPNCPEGALQIIDGKARLISDLFCDGLGACIGECPEGAISVIEREAEEYDEKKVMKNIVEKGRNVIKAHLEHLKSHNQTKYFRQAVEYLNENGIENPEESCKEEIEERQPDLHYQCLGLKLLDRNKEETETCISSPVSEEKSQLRQWPVQIMLVPRDAPYFDNADLLISADCVPFSFAGFHNSLLKGRILLVGCPKLDDSVLYRDKITDIFKNNNIKSVTVAHMEVPCCFSLVKLVEDAVKISGKNISIKTAEIGVKGDIKS
jgi:ferredoxin